MTATWHDDILMDAHLLSQHFSFHASKILFVRTAGGNPSSVPLRQSAADLSTRQSINDFSNYRGDCLEKYPHIQQKRTAPRIGNVKAYHFLVCCLVLYADLPYYCHTWNRIEPP